MLITLITGNKGKESKIEINILSKFLCTYHRPVGMDVNTTRHYTFIYTLMHSSVVYESIETPVPPSPGLCRDKKYCPVVKIQGTWTKIL